MSEEATTATESEAPADATLLSGDGPPAAAQSAEVTAPETQTAATQTTGFQINALFDENGGWNADFSEKLPDHLKGYAKSMKEHKSPADWLQSVAHQNTLVGRKFDDVTAPGVDADPDLKAAYRTRMGIPQEADGYEVAKPEGIPDEAWNEDRLSQVKKWAHENNLHPKALAQVIEMHTAFGLEDAQAYQATMEAQEAEFAAKQTAELQEKFGVEMPAKIDAARRAAESLGFTREEQGTLDMFKRADVVDAFARFAKAMGQHRYIDGSAGDSTYMTDKEKATDIQMNPKNELHDAYRGAPGIPEHVVNDTRQKVQRMLASGK